MIATTVMNYRIGHRSMWISEHKKNARQNDSLSNMNIFSIVSNRVSEDTLIPETTSLGSQTLSIWSKTSFRKRKFGGVGKIYDGVFFLNISKRLNIMH